MAAWAFMSAIPRFLIDIVVQIRAPLSSWQLARKLAEDTFYMLKVILNSIADLSPDERISWAAKGLGYICTAIQGTLKGVDFYLGSDANFAAAVVAVGANGQKYSVGFAQHPKGRGGASMKLESKAVESHRADLIEHITRAQRAGTQLMREISDQVSSFIYP